MDVTLFLMRGCVFFASLEKDLLLPLTHGQAPFLYIMLALEVIANGQIG